MHPKGIKRAGEGPKGGFSAAQDPHAGLTPRAQPLGRCPNPPLSLSLYLSLSAAVSALVIDESSRNIHSDSPHESQLQSPLLRAAAAAAANRLHICQTHADQLRSVALHSCHRT